MFGSPRHRQQITGGPNVKFQSRFVMTNHFRQHILVTFFVTIALLPIAAAKPRIVPLQTSVKFSTQASENRWSVPIKSTDGSTAYVLSLEPDFDVGHHIVTLELVLRHSADKSDGPNLLDPTRSRHGLQAYDFAADDLVQGVQKSAFGEKRTVTLKSLGLVLRITVSKAAVSTISVGNHQLDALDLQIEVDNLNP
jgi:hypothetical protein